MGGACSTHGKDKIRLISSKPFRSDRDQSMHTDMAKGRDADVSESLHCGYRVC
jgi:hypothetical protein